MSRRSSGPRLLITALSLSGRGKPAPDVAALMKAALAWIEPPPNSRLTYSAHSGCACLISAALQTYRLDVNDLPHCGRIRTFMLTAWLRGARLTALLSPT